ncbi:MAG: ATP-binding protein [Albidovulum sp.]
MNITEKLVSERRARLAAERLLDQKQRELFEANDRLSLHARDLAETLVVQRHDLEHAQHEKEALKGRNHQIESDLERAKTAARIAQRRLWEALETIKDGFAVFDDEMRLIIANGAYVDLFKGPGKLEAGQSYDAIIAMMARDGVIDLDGQDVDDWCHEMIARQAREVIDPKIVRLPDGRFLKFIDRRGEAGDLVCLTADITENVRREAELEEARIKAEAASRAKSAFLANMSHEIRTPMNGVVGMVDLLRETELNEEQRLFADTIKSSGEALLTIINDVLDYSKAEAEKLRLVLEPFDLERCLHEVMLLLQPSARSKGVSLVVDFDLFLPTRFVADPGRMRQILTNLLGNAVKFTSSGHVLARVVGIEAEGRFDLHFSIEDTGIGIAPEYIDHVFGEFNQVDDQSNRKFEGTGLGLAITRQLVELMGGEVWVDSELGKGSCFGFKVNLAPAENPASDGADQPILLKRALLIEEAVINRTILIRQLQTFGMEVKVCRNTEEALAAGTNYDIALLDHEMGDTESRRLALALRGAGLTAPMLISSSFPSKIDNSDGLFAGSMQKPILRSDLFRKLQGLSGTMPVATSVPLPPPVPQTTGPRQMRVLAAEDNRTNQLVFSKMVQSLDIDLVFASNGREAIERWRDFAPDLVFMDISMPEMDGREATRAIRQAEAQTGAHVTIVALTAHAMKGDGDDILAAGLDHYLTKPLRKAEILAKIAAACPPDARPTTPASTSPPGTIPTALQHQSS